MATRSDRILKLIAVMKLVKGTLLLTIAFGVLSIVETDRAHGIRAWVDELSPRHDYIRHAFGRLLSLNPHTLEMVTVATFIYAALFLTEGVGLYLKKLWAEYMTTVITISFIPVELYELVEHPSLTKLAVIIANILIVLYLAVRLRSDHHWPFRGARQTARS